MFEIKGKFNNCKVFTDNVDESCISQLYQLMNEKSIKDSKIRIMPDCHAGAGCAIGTTMTIKDKVIPNLVGVDIGCAVIVVKLKEKEIDLQKLDNVIRKYIPCGFNIRNDIHPYIKNINLKDLFSYKNGNINLDRAEKSLGTLGGGNHFIELDKDEYNNLYLVVHTGSRYLGKQVAEHYQDEAWNKLNIGNKKDIINKKIEELKLQGKEKDIQKEIEKINNEYQFNQVSKELAYCENELFDMYIHDMNIAQNYAYWNRKTIVDTILDKMDLHKEEEFQTIHNYIDIYNMILRKGSVSANKGEMLIIPINMRDGSLICIGKGNEDWNFSAPHGAGRIMSRSQAKDNINLKDFQKSMEGIYSTSVKESTLDESPFVYKPMEEIIDNIKDTVDIQNIIKPIYNFKAS